MTLEQILKDNYSDVRSFIKDGEDLSDSLYDALYDHYSEVGMIPYEVATSGDPIEWVGNQLKSHFNSGSQYAGV